MRPLLALAVAVSGCSLALGHPVPDIPVRGVFQKDGTAIVRVEIDPRCFAKDPLNEPYLENSVFQSYSEQQKSDLEKKAAVLIAEVIEFRLLPKGVVAPKFKMKATTFNNRPLDWNAKLPASNTIQCAQKPVMITAEWTLEASKATGYQIASAKSAKFSVQFINNLRNKKQPLHVLFPGEESFILRLQGEPAPAPPTSDTKARK